ncbi:high affinity nickel transport protein nic1 [Stemphylium lycopersici]|uniref:beta-ketoacyl-[acyl-carrier-protein] synthase I n=1 Tax=Stemphylium lycopersici TaxID=183478 RepID=A0A364N6Z1_STELY|nr:high affinity nickel transport protein nic1 [Stemphylium lycopersici]
MEISLQKSWDSGDAISNPQNVDEHLSTSNIRSIDTGETTKVAHSSPPGPLHNLSSNFQSETMPTASEMTGISENASELGRTLLRAYISNNSSYTGFMPPASAGTSRREMTYLEPNAPVTRTGVHDQGWEFGVPVRRAWLGGQSHTHGARPKRNRVTLVQEEEMNSFREDRAGTPHMSELLAEDNIVKAFSVEELGMERNASCDDIQSASADFPGVRQTWRRLIDGHCGITSIKDRSPEFALLPSQVAGIIPGGTKNDAKWDPKEHLSPTDERRMARFAQYAMVASDEALEDAGWFPKEEADLEATGPNHAATTACTTGAHSIGDASRLIQFGDANVMIAGGAESCIHPLAISGFAKARSLATEFNDRPTEASRPFDRQRDGFVIGEGAGVVVLEELEHAKKRGARIYAEIAGYGLSSDAHHMTAPREDGQGPRLAMKHALRHACIKPSAVDYVNAHATSTQLGDAAENRAIKELLLGEEGKSKASKVNISSTKGATGHLLGAAGSVEAIFTVLGMHHNTLPPTLNLANPGDPAEDFDCNYVVEMASRPSSNAGSDPENKPSFFRNASNKASMYHAGIPYLRKLPFPVIAIITTLVAVNLLVWAAVGVVLHWHTPLISTAVLSYTLGLRHALDADHISAIDLMTRRLIAAGQRPVTVGMFFSLGHSTIVIITSLVVAGTAAAVSDKFDNFERIGGIIGTSVSAAFLLLLGIMNIYILYKLIMQMRKMIASDPGSEHEEFKIQGGGCLFPVLQKLFKLVDRPWKMYPLGVLFGLGFDTSSEIAILGISSIQATKGTSIWLILIFPLLFTAGMCLLDTTDGALMMTLYTSTQLARDPIAICYYSIVLTVITVIVATIIGTVQFLNLVLNVAEPEGKFWEGVEKLGDAWDIVGGAICGTFIVFGGLSVLLYKPWRRRIDNRRATNAHFEPLPQDQETPEPNREELRYAPGQENVYTKDVDVNVEPVEATDVAGPARR